MEAVSFRSIATVEQLQLEYTHTQTHYRIPRMRMRTDITRCDTKCLRLKGDLCS